MIFSEPSPPPPDLGEVHVADEAEPFPRGQQTAEGDLTQAALHPDDEAASGRALGGPVFWMLLGGARISSLAADDSAKKLLVAAFPLDVLELPVIQTLSSHSASRPNSSKGPKPSIKGLEISMEPASRRPDQPRKTHACHDIGTRILCIHKLPASSLLVTSHDGGREIFPRVANPPPGKAKKSRACCRIARDRQVQLGNVSHADGRGAHDREAMHRGRKNPDIERADHALAWQEPLKVQLTFYLGGDGQGLLLAAVIVPGTGVRDTSVVHTKAISKGCFGSSWLGCSSATIGPSCRNSSASGRPQSSGTTFTTSVVLIRT